MALYKYLLFDNDGTIMDFEKAEELAFEDTFKSFDFNVPYSEELLTSYSQCNIRWWKKHELGECTKAELIIARFEEFLRLNNLSADAFEMNEAYKKFLSQNNQLFDGALEMLERLSKDYTIYIITNGVAQTQHGRIDNSPISQYIDKLFISEETGFSKPHTSFFEYVFEKGNIQNKSECLVIGDSLSSDIKGANNFGLDCIWYNPHNEQNTDCDVTFEAKTIEEIEKIIKDNEIVFQGIDKDSMK